MLMKEFLINFFILKKKTKNFCLLKGQFTPTMKKEIRV